jgi:hypothetical protein
MAAEQNMKNNLDKWKGKTNTFLTGVNQTEN